MLVHDAARPLVDDAVIERVLGRLDGTVDGVVPGVAVQDTVKRVSGGVVAETLDREGLVAVQTPQAFVADSLRAAFAGDLAGATDCASLVERRGRPRRGRRRRPAARQGDDARRPRARRWTARR